MSVGSARETTQIQLQGRKALNITLVAVLWLTKAQLQLLPQTVELIFLQRGQQMDAPMVCTHAFLISTFGASRGQVAARGLVSHLMIKAADREVEIATLWKAGEGL